MPFRITVITSVLGLFICDPYLLETTFVTFVNVSFQRSGNFGSTVGQKILRFSNTTSVSVVTIVKNVPNSSFFQAYKVEQTKYLE